MTRYPETFPLDEIRFVINTIRAGTISHNRSDMVKDLWTLQGYAQLKVFGEPDATPTMQSVPIMPDELPADDEALSMLQAAVNAEESQDEADLKMASFNWHAILAWVVQAMVDVLIG